MIYVVLAGVDYEGYSRPRYVGTDEQEARRAFQEQACKGWYDTVVLEVWDNGKVVKTEELR